MAFALSLGLLRVTKALINVELVRMVAGLPCLQIEPYYLIAIYLSVSHNLRVKRIFVMLP